jgi:hypothetical protein
MKVVGLRSDWGYAGGNPNLVNNSSYSVETSSKGRLPGENGPGKESAPKSRKDTAQAGGGIKEEKNGGGSQGRNGDIEIKKSKKGTWN